MSLWGKSLAAESRPKGFPDDSNSKYARENIFATNKGWVVRGVATGNEKVFRRLIQQIARPEDGAAWRG